MTKDLVDEEPTIDGWASETIELPPGFAPEMPTGVEELRFAPGWRNPESENFWSYAIVMRIDEPVADSKRVTELLECYFDGLMSVFASNKSRIEDIQPTRVRIDEHAPNGFKARMYLTDAFATFEPIGLFVLIETAGETDSRSSVRIRVSFQPFDHQIWRSMEMAILDILKRDP